MWNFSSVIDGNVSYCVLIRRNTISLCDMSSEGNEEFSNNLIISEQTANMVFHLAGSLHFFTRTSDIGNWAIFLNWLDTCSRCQFTMAEQLLMLWISRRCIRVCERERESKTVGNSYNTEMDVLALIKYNISSWIFEVLYPYSMT